MKKDDIVKMLGEIEGNPEIWFWSCCYPMTKWFEIDDDTLVGYEGSYVDGDPEESPYKKEKEQNV